MEYPEEHLKIVNALLRDGRFLVEGETAFACLKEHQAFYQQFFRASFQLELSIEADYALLKSSRQNDALARDICIFLAILSYEIDREGRNLLETLQFSVFSLEDIEQKFLLSSFLEILEATPGLRDADRRSRFITQITRRNLIVKMENDSFRFTPAFRYFLDYARTFNHLLVVQEEE